MASPAQVAVRVTVVKLGAAVAVSEREPGVPVASLVDSVQPPRLQPVLSGPAALENVSTWLVAPASLVPASLPPASRRASLPPASTPASLPPPPVAAVRPKNCAA